MELGQEHLDAKVSGVEFGLDFSLKLNTDSDERFIVKATLKSEGITLRELLYLAAKPRVISKQGSLRRGCKDDAGLGERIAELNAVGCVISLKPGSMAGAGRPISNDEAINTLEERIKSGKLTREYCAQKPHLLRLYDAIMGDE